MSHDVFISHSSRDKQVGNAICARLEQRGMRCWIAPRDILPGQEWGEAIIEGISGARAFVLVFSGHANDSPQVRREVERAVGHGLPLLPFRIEDVSPVKSLEYFISNQHWLDALTPPLDRHLDELADAVGRLIGVPAVLSPAPAPPPMPVTRVRRGRAALWAGGVLGAIVLAGLLFLLLRSSGEAESTAQVMPAPASAPAPVAAPAPARPQTEPDAPETRTDASAMVGAWSGVVLEPWSDAQRQYPVEVRIEAGADGRPRGIVRYGSFPCGGTWTPERREGAKWRFRETLTSGVDNCAAGVVAELEPSGGDFLNVGLFLEDRPDLVSRGTLHRVRGERSR